MAQKKPKNGYKKISLCGVSVVIAVKCRRKRSASAVECHRIMTIAVQLPKNLHLLQGNPTIVLEIWRQILHVVNILLICPHYCPRTLKQCLRCTCNHCFKFLKIGAATKFRTLIRHIPFSSFSMFLQNLS